VIDEAAFRKVSSYIDLAKTEGGQVLAGGTYDGTKGWFITPTVIVTENPLSTTMREEIFGPVLTVYVYDDKQWRETLRLVDETSPYGLTGSVFSDDRSALREAADALRYTCGNLYINDKSTGAVVGQQPFGGGRVSGSNDKPGGPQFLHRWVTSRTIKENFESSPQVSYPHQLPDDVVVK
jgi:1-pyrroline-5-carboxylate dehydrogenase